MTKKPPTKKTAMSPGMKRIFSGLAELNAECRAAQASEASQPLLPGEKKTLKKSGTKPPPATLLH